MSAPQAGDLVMRRIITGVLGCDLTPHDAAHQLEIVQADPHILVTDEILHDLDEHLHHRWHLQHCTRAMRLDPPPGAPPPMTWAAWHDHEIDADPWPCNGLPISRTRDCTRCWYNWLLRVDAINRTVIYRIGRYRAELNAWEASWPD